MNMPKRIMTLLVAATLAGCLFAPETQALGRVGGGHGGGLGGVHIGGGHIGGVPGIHIGGLDGMHLPSVVGDTHIGSHFDRTSMGSVGIMGDNYSIMAPERGSRVQTPEPWLAPTYKSPRGTVKHVVIPKSKIVSPPNAAVPPSLFVPQTGQTFQNLPTLSGSGLGGAETFQDPAARCAHQAGVYGQATTGSYMGACVNQ